MSFEYLCYAQLSYLKARVFSSSLVKELPIASLGERINAQNGRGKCGRVKAPRLGAKSGFRICIYTAMRCAASRLPLTPLGTDLMTNGKAELYGQLRALLDSVCTWSQVHLAACCQVCRELVFRLVSRQVDHEPE